MTDDLRLVQSPNEPLPNARLFVADCFAHEDHPTLVSHGGIFYMWNGHRWRELEDSGLRSLLYNWFEEAVHLSADGPVRFEPTKAKIVNIIDALHAATYLSSDISPPTWLPHERPTQFAATEAIVCENVTLHVPTRMPYRHTPRLFVQHSVPFDYDPLAASPIRWLSFLNQLWPDDPETVAAIQEMFGYILSGDTSLQKMFLLIGPKRSGKGTIARVLTALMGGRKLVAGPTLNSLSQNFGLQPMIGKPLAVISDARVTSGQSVIIERLLSISGEDMLTIDRKNREAWTGTLPTRIVMLTNELPRLSDSSGALASRFVPYETTVSFFGKEDPDLTDDLLRELPGILNWTLDGLDRVQKAKRLTVPASSEDVRDALDEIASPATVFVREACDLGPMLRCTKEELFNAWQSWCIGQGRDHPGSLASFGIAIRAAIPDIKTVKVTVDGAGRRNAYEGIAPRQRSGNSWS